VILAIETHYKGYRFRSRLEARWAVFFDQAGITYQYELQGFRLPSGLYLPDFYLPDAACGTKPTAVRAYVEIKPLPYPCTKSPDPDYPNHALPRPLPREVLLGHELVRVLGDGTQFVVVYGDPVHVLQFDDGGAIAVMPDHALRAGHVVGALDSIPVSLWEPSNAARAARFEHGERPAWAREV
jgi:hypothetical protein